MDMSKMIGKMEKNAEVGKVVKKLWRLLMILPFIYLKQIKALKKRKFAKEVKPRQKEIVCGRFLPALIAGQLIPFGAIVSV